MARLDERTLFTITLLITFLFTRQRAWFKCTAKSKPAQKQPCYAKANFIVILPFSGISIFAQEQIRGTITDPTDNELAYINVFLYAAQDSSFITGSITNDEGYFDFHSLKEGVYFIEVETCGYLPYQSETFTIADDTEVLKIRLRRQIALSEN